MGVVVLERDQVVRLRDRVVHERGREELARLVEGRLFPQRLADALSEAAVHLALDEQRVDEEARVVHRHVREDGDPARVLVHLDGGDVGAEGEEHARARLDVLVGAEAALGGRSDLLPGDGAIGHAPHGELAVGQDQILRGGFEELGRDLLRLVPDLHRLAEGVHAAARRRAAAEGADTVPDERGVALDDLDHLHRNLELVGHQLGIRRLVSLAVGGRAREHGHAPVVGHHEVRDLVLLEAADLDVGGEPDAHEPALGARRLLLPAQLLVAGLDERMVEGARVLAAVVGVAERRVVGETVRRDEVAPPHFGRVESDLRGEQVHAALDEVSRFGAPGAAVRHCAHRVGEGAANLGPRRLDVVAARDHLGAEDGQEAADVVEAVADIAGDLRVERQDAPVRIRGQPQVAAHVAAVPGCLHVLAPRRRPAHGAVEALGEHRDDGVFLVHGHFRAKPASHAPGHQVDLLGLELEPLGDLVPHAVGDLRVSPHGHLLRLGVPHGAARARLHADREDALVDHLDVDDDGRRLEGRIHIALLALEQDAEIGAGVGVQERRALREGGLRVHDDRQRLVVHHHRLGPVHGGGGRLRGNHGHRLTHVAHAPLGQHRVSLLVHRGEHLGRDRRVDDAHLGVDVGARQHRDHSRDLLRCARVDALEDCVRVRAPDESQLQRALVAQPAQGTRCHPLGRHALFARRDVETPPTAWAGRRAAPPSSAAP